jgi:hypothetical protein
MDGMKVRRKKGTEGQMEGGKDGRREVVAPGARVHVFDYARRQHGWGATVGLVLYMCVYMRLFNTLTTIFIAIFLSLSLSPPPLPAPQHLFSGDSSYSHNYPPCGGEGEGRASKRR